jgi:hypothetical protein
MKEVKLFKGWNMRDGPLVARHEKQLSELLNEGWEIQSTVALDYLEGVLIVLVRDTDVGLDIMNRDD